MEPQAPYYPPVMTEADQSPREHGGRGATRRFSANLDSAIGPSAVVEVRANLDRGIRHNAEEVNRWKQLEEQERNLRVQIERRLFKVSLLALALFAWGGIATILYVVKVWR